jgi:3-deoxy-manno-octulosonate cytidylyltransferase (CMP-KDO synthetase)
MHNRTAIIIPARYASTRFPAKPLAQLRGPDGSKSLIERSWEAAVATGLENIYVATDHDDIAKEVKRFGGNVLMTSDTCRNGTERCAEAVEQLKDIDVVVNLQGDAPLTPPWFIHDLLEGLFTRDAGVATPVVRLEPETYEMFKKDRAAGQVGGTTAVFNSHGKGLYFSKEIVPYVPENYKGEMPVWHHVGAYAYTREALQKYAQTAPSLLENLEGLEQLRFLDCNVDVQCVPVDARGRVFWELNNPIDISRLEKVLNA